MGAWGMDALLRMAKYSRSPEKWMFRAKQIAHLICDQLEPHINELDSVDFHLGDGHLAVLSYLIDVSNPNSMEAGFPVFE